MRLLENVQPRTIQPLIQAPSAPGTGVSTDAYDLDSRLKQWGYAQERICHSRGASARDDDGEGLHAVHVNTMAGVWALLRSLAAPASRHLTGPCAAFFGLLCGCAPRETTGHSVIGSLAGALARLAPRNPY
jgi:transposase